MFLSILFFSSVCSLIFAHVIFNFDNFSQFNCSQRAMMNPIARVAPVFIIVISMLLGDVAIQSLMNFMMSPQSGVIVWRGWMTMWFRSCLSWDFNTCNVSLKYCAW